MSKEDLGIFADTLSVDTVIRPEKTPEEEILEKRLDWTRKSIKDIEFIERKFHELKENVSE